MDLPASVFLGPREGIVEALGPAPFSSHLWFIWNLEVYIDTLAHIQTPSISLSPWPPNSRWTWIVRPYNLCKKAQELWTDNSGVLGTWRRSGRERAKDPNGHILFAAQTLYLMEKGF